MGPFDVMNAALCNAGQQRRLLTMKNYLKQRIANYRIHTTPESIDSDADVLALLTGPQEIKAIVAIHMLADYTEAHEMIPELKISSIMDRLGAR